MKDIFQSESIYKINSNEMDENSLNFIMEELSEGFKIFNDSEKFISVFGSARVSRTDDDYKSTEIIGSSLAKAGYAVVTGGGPGIMEAAAKGAFLSGGNTYGINVLLPHEQMMNEYIKRKFYCKYLFTRKVLLMKNSCGFIIMPGGFGTMDELYEIVTLISVGVAKPVPIILVGSYFWKGMIGWLKEQFITKGFITENELNVMVVEDNVDKIIDIIKTHTL